MSLDNIKECMSDQSDYLFNEIILENFKDVFDGKETICTTKNVFKISPEYNVKITMQIESINRAEKTKSALSTLEEPKKKRIKSELESKDE